MDQALFRRFDDVLHYSMPTQDEIRRLFKLKLGVYDRSLNVADSLIKQASTLSHAEIIRVCDDAIKSSILQSSKITEKQLTRLIDERISAYSVKEA